MGFMEDEEEKKKLPLGISVREPDGTIAPLVDDGGMNVSPLPGDLVDAPAESEQPSESKFASIIKAAALSPRGFGPELDDNALKAAQDNGKKKTDAADWNRIGKDYVATLRGTKPMTGLADSLDAQGRQGVQDILTRRKAAGESQEFAAKQADSDPASEGSRAYQENVLEIMKASGAVSPKMEEAIRAGSRKSLMEQFPLLKETIEARAKKTEKTTKGSTEQADADNLRKLMKADKRYAHSIAALGADFDIAPYKTLKEFMDRDDSDFRAAGSQEAQRDAARLQRANHEGDVQTEHQISHDRDVKNDVEKLSSKLPADYNDFYGKYARINKIISASPGDIPGVGFWDSRKPNWLQSDAGIALSKDAMQLNNAYRHLITGAGANAQELAALEKATTDMSNERSFKAGLESLKQLYDAKVAQIKAGYSSEALEQYEANLKRVSGRGTQKSGTPSPPPLEGHGKVVKETSSFRSYEDGFIEEKGK